MASEIEIFVGKVVARLESQGLSRTSLADEWTAIREVSGEEKEFCETTGALGLNPYDLDDDRADEIFFRCKESAHGDEAGVFPRG